MNKIAFALLLVLVVAELVVTRQVSPTVILPLVLCGWQLVSPSTESGEVSPILKWVMVFTLLPFCLMLFAELLLRPSVLFARTMKSPAAIFSAFYLVPLALLLIGTLRSKRPAMPSETDA